MPLATSAARLNWIELFSFLLMQSSLPRRPICAACQRPLSACICQWVTPVDHAVEVLILQHPAEVQHAKNSAGLLHRCLRHSRMLVGETFEPAALQAALPQARYVVLLYPATQSDGHAIAPPLEMKRLQAADQVGLVVVDATWRKSRKMLHQNPLLQSLPRLAQLEGDAHKFLPLQRAFQGFVLQQAAQVPAHAGAAHRP